MVLAGQQQTAELKLALDQELHKSKQLEEYVNITAELKLALATCHTNYSTENGTVFISRITPMQVVNMLNSMYSMFDELTERHCVYKVETIGDAYMICSGGGILDGQDNLNHAHKVCEIALDMIRVVFTLRDPSSGNSLNIRIVNTASRIESSSEAQMVQISEMTKGMLDQNEWDIYERGTIQLKGKGFMKDQSSDNSSTCGDDTDKRCIGRQTERLLVTGDQMCSSRSSSLAALDDKYNRSALNDNRSLIPLVSMTQNNTFSQKQLNRLMALQLSKQLFLSDNINTTTTATIADNEKNNINYNIKNNEKNVSIIGSEGQLQQQPPALSSVAIDRLNTIHNPLMTGDAE
ncbi:unnamed protein product, partial [Medioppia subpectinata]